MDNVRPVMLSIDDLVEILKGYLGDELVPPDAKAVKLMQNPQHKNKIGLLIESSHYGAGIAPQEIKFDIRRMFSTGG